MTMCSRKQTERVILILLAVAVVIAVVSFIRNSNNLSNQNLNSISNYLTNANGNVNISTKTKCANRDFISDKTIHANQTATGMPKLVWMYWDKGLDHLEELSKNNPPNRYAADFSCVTAMMEMNPTWNVVVLNEDSAKEYAPIFASVMCNETLYRMLLPALKGDLLRLELLSRYGGIYVDTSICPLKPFDNFITEWVGKETNGFYAKSSNLGSVPRSELHLVALGNVPKCHDHSQINNTGVPGKGKGYHFRTSSNWMLASTNPHNPIVDEWLAILHGHYLSLHSKPPYFIAHCSLTQARLYNETVDAIWVSTFKRYRISDNNACFKGAINGGPTSKCAVVKRPTKMFVLSGNYSKRIQLEINPHSASNGTELHLLSPVQITEEEKEFVSKNRRFGAMNATAGIFSYVHISKCSGSTWVTLLKQLNLDVFPIHRAGQEEFSVQFQRNKLGTSAAYHSTTLRSPRHHVLSMFLHCKYFNIAKHRFQWNGTDETDFKAWLDYHLPMGPHNRDMHECDFHPANYQSRHLTSSARRPHGLEGGDPFDPDIRAALRTYWDLDFVSLTEFVHESRCLLYYRLKSNTTTEALAYLDNNCRCDAHTHEGATTTAKDNVHVSHHSGSHRLNVRDLPMETLSKVHELTRIDVDIYNIALRHFMKEIAWLESNAALGRRVLCDDVLKLLEPELSYLPSADGQETNVTKIYLEIIGRSLL